MEGIHMRVSHKLRGNRSVWFPQWHLFVDTETYQRKIGDKTVHVFKIGYMILYDLKNDQVVYSGIFTKKRDFYSYIKNFFSSRRKILHIWFYNAHFDFHVLSCLYYLGKDGWETKSAVFSHVFRWVFKKNSYKLVIVDAGNYSPIGVGGLGELIGLRKVIIEDWATVKKEELEERVRIDTEILFMFVSQFLKFLKNNNLCSFGWTISQVAFKTFRHRFYDEEKEPIYIHAHEATMKLERESYRGGICENFYRGERYDLFYKLDINSSYPFICRNYPLPTKLVKYCNTPCGFWSAFKNKNYGVIADVTIHTKVRCVAVRKKINGETKLVMPVGTFRCVLTTPELKLLLALGGKILKVHRYAVYLLRRGVFKDFVDYFYGLRRKFKKEGNSLYDYFCKIILNSLTGKWGQKSGGEVRHLNLESPEFGFEEHLEEKDEKLFNVKIMKLGRTALAYYEEERESMDGFTAIVSFITAYARCRLVKFLLRAGFPNGETRDFHVYYSDTDSLITDYEGYRRLLPFISPKLGMLKLEEEACYVKVNAPKDYEFGSVRKMKGVSKTAKPLSENSFLLEQWFKTRGLWRRSLIHPVTVHVVKILKRQLKGVLGADGWVYPLKLKEKGVEK